MTKASIFVALLIVCWATFAGRTATEQPLRFVKYANGTVDQPFMSQIVQSELHCAVMCEKLLVCSAFSLKASSAVFNAYMECRIALGDFTWSEDPESSIFLEDMGILSGFSFAPDGRFYRFFSRNKTITITDARQLCVANGGDLAVPYPKHRRDAIMKILPEGMSANFFVGVTQQRNGTNSSTCLTDDGNLLNTTDPLDMLNQPWVQTSWMGNSTVCTRQSGSGWVRASCYDNRTVDQVVCRKESVYYTKQANGKYYKVYHEKKTAAMAAEVCASDAGGTLANVYRGSDWAAIAGYRARADYFVKFLPSSWPQEGFFVGGSDHEVEGLWKLPDGSSFDAANRTDDPDQHWLPGEPKGGITANSLFYSSGSPEGGLRDSPEDNIFRFLCELVVM